MRRSGKRPVVYAAAPYWEITAPKDGAAFMRALPNLLPADAVLCIEGTAVAAEVRAVLLRHKVVPDVRLARDTILPRSTLFYFRMTAAAIADVAALFEKHSAPEIGDHLKAFQAGIVLLWWHDAFYDYPLAVSAQLPEVQIKAFCRQLDCECRLVQ
jgi:hypothetical protein